MAPLVEVNPKDLRIFLLPDGSVSLECQAMSPNDNLACFGDKGACPPHRFASLLDECLDMVAAVPDAPDTAALRSMASDLKSSLTKVETTLARLNRAGD